MSDESDRNPESEPAESDVPQPQGDLRWIADRLSQLERDVAALLDANTDIASELNQLHEQVGLGKHNQQSQTTQVASASQAASAAPDPMDALDRHARANGLGNLDVPGSGLASLLASLGKQLLGLAPPPVSPAGTPANPGTAPGPGTASGPGQVGQPGQPQTTPGPYPGPAYPAAQEAQIGPEGDRTQIGPETRRSSPL